MPFLLHYDIGRSQQRWDIQIRKFGGPALLRQQGIADRPVSQMPSQFTAMERLGGISNPLDRKVLLSAIDPTTGGQLNLEPSEKDALVTLVLDGQGKPEIDASGNFVTRELLKIVAPPSPVGPIRDTPLYWKLQVRA